MGPPKKRFFVQLGDIARATVFPENIVTSKKQFVLVYAVRLLFLVGSRVWRDRCPRQAAALAYQTFLSMMPLIVLVLAVASTLELDWYREKMITFLQQHLLPESTTMVVQKIGDMAKTIKPRTLGTLGAATLVLIAMTLLFTVEQAVNEIFRCPKNRRLITRILTSLLLLIFAPLALGLSLYYTGTLFALPRFATGALPYLFSTLAMFLCYWRLPHRKIQIKHSLISAVTAAFMFEIVKWAFALYANHVANTLSAVYGTLMIVPLFMIWVYLAWLIFLFGAELNAALHEVSSHDRFA